MSETTKQSDIEFFSEFGGFENVDLEAATNNLENAEFVDDEKETLLEFKSDSDEDAKAESNAINETLASPNAGDSIAFGEADITEDLKKLKEKEKAKAKEPASSGETPGIYKPYIKLSIGSLTFENTSGDILIYPQPYLRYATYRHHEFYCVLLDPDGGIRKQISEYGDATIEFGFVKGTTRTFKSKIFSIGSMPPHGTEIIAIDETAVLAQSTQSGVLSSEAAEGKKAEELKGKLQVYEEENADDVTASGSKLDLSKLLASHADLPFGSKLEITIAPPPKPKEEESETPKDEDKPIEEKTDKTETKVTGKKVTVEIIDRPKRTTALLVVTPAVVTGLGLELEDVPNDGISVVAKILSKGKEEDEDIKKDSEDSEDTEEATPKTVEAQIDESAKEAQATERAATALGQLGQKLGVKVDNSSTTGNRIANIGSVTLAATAAAKASIDAAMQGDTVVTKGSGDEVKQVSPGKEEDSGIILDYNSARDAFIGRPRARKNTGLRLQSGFGAMVVSGYSISDKQAVGATVVTPGMDVKHPTGVMNVPDWGDIKVSDPIISGGKYTWGDATKNGVRVPNKEAMQKIAAIAQVIEQLTEKAGGTKWNITSWYRPEPWNSQAGGVSNSQHLFGNAVDCNFPGYQKLHAELKQTWDGGIAISHRNNFLHIDLGPRRRWNYP